MGWGPNPDGLSSADRDQLIRYEEGPGGGSRHSARWDAASDTASLLTLAGGKSDTLHSASSDLEDPARAGIAKVLDEAVQV
jgi:hypothetical protein